MNEQSSKAKRWLFTLGKLAWLAVALAVLGDWLYFWVFKASSAPPAYKGEVGVLLIWVMMFLSFPAGVLWYALLALIYLLLDAFGARPEQPSLLEGALIWVGFLVFGYLQWFTLVPRLYRKLKTRWQNSRTSRNSRLSQK